MRQVECGTSWQSKASMLPSANLIAQRLQIETLRCCRRAYESCRKTQQQVRIDGSPADGQREVHPGGAVGFDRGRYVEQGEWYFLARLAVKSIEGAAGERVVMNLLRRAAILENQGCGGLGMHGSRLDCHLVGGAEGRRRIGGNLRARRFRAVIHHGLVRLAAAPVGGRSRRPGHSRRGRHTPTADRSRSELNHG